MGPQQQQQENTPPNRIGYANPKFEFLKKGRLVPPQPAYQPLPQVLQHVHPYEYHNSKRRRRGDRRGAGELPGFLLPRQIDVPTQSTVSRIVFQTESSSITLVDDDITALPLKMGWEAMNKARKKLDGMHGALQSLSEHPPKFKRPIKDEMFGQVVLATLVSSCRSVRTAKSLGFDCGMESLELLHRVGTFIERAMDVFLASYDGIKDKKLSMSDLVNILSSQRRDVLKDLQEVGTKLLTDPKAKSELIWYFGEIAKTAARVLEMVGKDRLYQSIQQLRFSLLGKQMGHQEFSNMTVDNMLQRCKEDTLLITL
ncbi:MAG: hypothetical protein SGILL_001498, partial [Bacillariaceae sp.]